MNTRRATQEEAHGVLVVLHNGTMTQQPEPWPALPSNDWTDTLETLHLWTQVLGKIRLNHAPWVNHSWSVPLYMSPVGLRTSLVPHRSQGFEWTLDLHQHTVHLQTTTGFSWSSELAGLTVADFYHAAMNAMADAGIDTTIDLVPNEIADAVAFDTDHTVRTYVPDHARSLFQVLLRTNHILTHFRAEFLGKASPTHFFWGSFDLAVSRFSGRTAPPHPGGIPNFPDDVAREAYSHEVSSAGFWPGNRDAPDPIFYSYVYPTPDGFSTTPVRPDDAQWNDNLGEFTLPYDALTSANDPDAVLLDFYRSTYDAAADTGNWDRDALECASDHGPLWWHRRRNTN